MNFSFEFCVLTAVSTEDQATEDKDSLDFQFQRARAFGESLGGRFTREYRADGFSRSGWWELTPVLQQCEAFQEFARDGRLHLFQVAIVESYDRLGDLGMMFFNFFAAHGPPYIQLISVQQKIMIEDPATYHPRRDDSIPAAIADALKYNKQRTNKIFRGFEVGIPKRARDGKYSRRLPTGYKNTGTKKEYRVELDPAFKAKLLDTKDKYLQGWTLPALEQLTGWKRSTIKEMLRNPFYAGYTTYDRGYTNTSGTWVIKDDVELFPGLHEPIWDLDTYYTLVAEIKRRGEHLRHKRSYPLTGLVICEECDRRMHISPANNQNYQHYTYYRCRGCELSIREPVIMSEFIKELKSALAEIQDEPLLQEIEPVDNSRAIAALKKQLEKVRIAYETTDDAYSPEEYARRKREIGNEIKKLEDVEHQREQQLRDQRNKRDALQFVRDLLPGIEVWMTDTPVGEVNVVLSQAVECVKVKSDKTVSVKLK